MILDLLQKRFSCRQFRDKSIPDEVVHDMLEAARFSPSGGNEQPWCFGVITDRALIHRIAETAYQQTWIASAPLLVILCTIGVGDECEGRETQKRRFPEYTTEIDAMDQSLYWALNQEEHQTKIAGTHMVIAALEHGVCSCWVSWFEVRNVAELLNLPPDCLPSEILVFGYPAKQRMPQKKKKLEKIVFYNTFPHIPSTQFDVPTAQQYTDEGRLEEWIHIYLNTGEWANPSLSEGLKLQQRWWRGPLEIKLADLTRCCGPEPHMKYRVDPDHWTKRTAMMAQTMTDIFDIPPLIVEYCQGELNIRDGSTRYAAMQLKGWQTCWVFIWYNTEGDYQDHHVV